MYSTTFKRIKITVLNIIAFAISHETMNNDEITLIYTWFTSIVRSLKYIS